MLERRSNRAALLFPIVFSVSVHWSAACLTEVGKKRGVNGPPADWLHCQSPPAAPNVLLQGLSGFDLVFQLERGYLTIDNVFYQWLKRLKTGSNGHYGWAL